MSSTPVSSSASADQTNGINPSASTNSSRFYIHQNIDWRVFVSKATLNIKQLYE
jgi:hypothetical protein